MTLGITRKLLLAFLLVNLALVGTIALVVSVSFERGFLGYITESELAGLDEVAERLQAAYLLEGDWRFLKNNRRLWHRLAEGERAPRNVDPPARQTERPRRAESETGWRWKPRAEREPRGEFQTRRPPPPRRQPPPAYFPRLSLLAADDAFVAGAPDVTAGHARRPLAVEGQVVGWLALAPLDSLVDTVDVRFKQQQLQTLYMIGAASLLIALLVSFLLARHFLAPVKALTKGAHALTAGKFDSRIEVSATDELGQLAADFNTLANTLEQNEQARKQWVADISHELRTPLAVLRGEIEAMQDGIRPLDAEHLQSLHAEVLHLGKLVNDLYELSLSDIGALTYRKADEDPVEILENSLAGFIERFHGQKITLDVNLKSDVPLTVFADADRLMQLFDNLLTNTLRYTDAGGRLKVWLERHDKTLVINLQDSAPGVPEAQCAKLFERLYRMDESRNRAKGGAGLGMSICKNIVEAHEGTITAQPSPLGGVWIRVELPIAG